MQIINISDAKMHLSKLVDKAAKGEAFIIAKAGKPLVKVIPLNKPSDMKVRRIGFMAGQITVPDDFDRIAAQM